MENKTNSRYFYSDARNMHTCLSKWSSSSIINWAKYLRVQLRETPIHKKEAAESKI